MVVYLLHYMPFLSWMTPLCLLLSHCGCWTSAAAEWQITTHSQTFTLSGTLVLLYASQSKSNFPEMVSHHVHNQALIASDIAYHFPTVTLKKQPMAWAIIHKYPTMNMCSGNRWFIVQADKRLSFPHHSPGREHPGAGRPLPCFHHHAFVCTLESQGRARERAT